MAKSSAPKTPKRKPLLTRPETIGLCKRFLKDDKYEGAQALMAMYKLIKQYPSREFWLAYQLGFQLNSLFWFLGKDGQERLARDWSLYQLKLKQVEQPKLEENKVGDDVVVERPKTSVADFLR